LRKLSQVRESIGQRDHHLNNRLRTNDHLVGTLKGVILKINPDEPSWISRTTSTAFDLLDGALAIGSAYSYFPPKQSHVVVVDPGVGTETPPAACQRPESVFVAPDTACCL